MKIKLDKALQIDRRIRAGYMTAFILLFLAYILTFYTTRQVLKQQSLVNHNNSVYINLQALIYKVKDAEGSLGLFAATNDSRFLIQRPGTHDLDSVFSNLYRLFELNEQQRTNLEIVHHLVDYKFRLIDSGFSIYQQQPGLMNLPLQENIRKQTGIMDSLRFYIKKMQDTEALLIRQRQASMENSSTALQIINITSLVIALTLAAYSITTFNKENRAKKEASKKVLLYSNELEKKVAELGILNKELVNLKSIEKFAATGRIARTIAHEVRNPLTNISLAAEQLKGEIKDNEETDLLLEMINRNTGRINQLITDLLNSTKFAQLDYRQVGINQLLDETLQFAKDRIELKRVRVEKHYTKTDMQVLVDDEKMKIAFLNIIVNAIEAMQPDSGVLTITTVLKGETCQVVIADNGAGISEELLPHLFEPYFTSKAKGSGLGLTNTQNIILNHKGNIYAESVEDKGTSFYISLNILPTILK